MEHDPNEVVEKDGIGIYVFLWSHIRRVIGDMRIYTGWGHTMPFYTIEDDEVVRKGNFANGRWFTSWMYEMLYKSYLIQYSGLNFPINTTQEHLVITAEIIKKAKQLYAQQFKNENFYVLIHPSDWTDFEATHKVSFLKLLEERSIDYMDYSEAFPLDHEHVIVGDGHPNALAYEKLSKLIISDLNIETTRIP